MVERLSMQRWVKNNPILFLLLISGTVTWSLTMVKSGWVSSYGMGFWGANGHDGIWHIALINSLARGSLNMPTFADVGLKNYHIGFDFLLAIIHNLTQIPTSILYFQIFPPVAAVLIGYLTYKLVLSWKNSSQPALWAVFFVYFAGGWGWLISYLREGAIGGESMFWAQASISTLVNPPFAFSLIILLLGLLALLKFKTDKSVIGFIVALICFGILIEVKAYAGILAYIGLGMVTLYEALKTRKIFNPYVQLLTASIVISLVLFLPLNSLSSGLLIFSPFWFLETMMAVSDRVSWPRFYEAMLNWRAAGMWYKAIPAYFIAFLIFWFGNMGTRAIKEPLMLNWTKRFKSLNQTELFMASVMISGIAFSMLFVQKGNPWNTIQFLYYSLFFASITAGISTSEILEYLQKKTVVSLKYVLALLIILLTIPTTLSTLWYVYLPSRPPAKLSQNELDALRFLNKQPEGIVLTFPFDDKKAEAAISNPPRPLYLYDSTAYVSAFTNKEVYLEDEVNLDIMDYPWKQRREKVEKFYSTLVQQDVRDFLRDNKISYIYWLKGQRATLGEEQLCISRLYENQEVDIYKVGKIIGNDCSLN